MEAVETNLEPGRLRRITQSLLSLQSGGGLTSAAFGLFLFGMCAQDVLPGRTGDLLPAVAALSWWLADRYVPKYYERRFGHVESSSSSESLSARGFLILLLVLLILAIVGPAIGRRADVLFGNLDNQLHILISDPERRVSFAPILYWAFLLMIGVLGAGPNRNKSLVLAATFIGICWTAFFFYPLHHPEVAHLLLWKIVSTGWLGISIMAIGLYEHSSVVLLLPKRPRAQTDL